MFLLILRHSAVNQIAGLVYQWEVGSRYVSETFGEILMYKLLELLHP